MKWLIAALAILLPAVAGPVDAEAHGRRGDGGKAFRGHGGRHSQSHRHHRRFTPHRPLLPFLVSPSVVVGTAVAAPPPLYASPPVYVPPPAAYGGLPYAPPPPPPVPRVVEFPTGRYELRGDGVLQPYVWVWIPNPPLAPPPPVPPQPAQPPAGEPAPPASGRPARPSPVYRWTDESGVTTWTDSLEKVPARFRAEASTPAFSR